MTQWSGHDADDTLYDFRSSADYDPAPEIGRIKAPMLAINFADDQVNPAQFSVTGETIARLPSGQLIVLPGGYGGVRRRHCVLSNPFGPSITQIPR